MYSDEFKYKFTKNTFTVNKGTKKSSYDGRNYFFFGHT